MSLFVGGSSRWVAGRVVATGAALLCAAMFAASAEAASTILGSTGSAPYGITVDSAGNIYTANSSSNNVSKITPAGVSTINWAATGNRPVGITVDSAGNIYTANQLSNNVTKITHGGTPTTL